MLEKTGQVKRYTDGEIIFKEGSSGRIMYLIKSGKVRLTRESVRGGENVEVTLGILSKDDYFGEMAIFDFGSRSATAVALGEVILKIITQKDLQAMIEESPNLAWLFLRRMSERIRMIDNKVESLLVREKLEKRVCDELEIMRYPEHLKQII